MTKGKPHGETPQSAVPPSNGVTNGTGNTIANARNRRTSAMKLEIQELSKQALNLLEDCMVVITDDNIPADQRTQLLDNSCTTPSILVGWQN